MVRPVSISFMVGLVAGFAIAQLVCRRDVSDGLGVKVIELIADLP